MDTKYSKKSFVEALMIVLGVAYAGVLTAFTLTTNPPNLGAWKDVGIPIAIILVVAGILLHFMDLQTALENKIPDIDVIDSPIVLNDITMRMTIQDSGIAYNVVGVSHMAHIVLSNNPKIRTDKNSPEKVRALITYLYTDKHPIAPSIQGRWSETYQPSQLASGQRMVIESVDFPNNGAERMLDILMKYPEDPYCYGYNNTSYDYPYYANPKLEIQQSRFFVKVELIGSYLPSRTWMFEVFTNGVGDTFSIRHKGNWIKAETSLPQKIVSKTPLQKTPARKKSAAKKSKPKP